MRVLELGKFYPPERGGMETALQHICGGLAARGHEVTAVVAAAGREGRREEIDGIVLHRLPRWGTLNSVPLCPELAPTLSRLAGELRPDVVHLHLPNPLMAASWMLAGDATPLVVSWHSDIVRQRSLAAMWRPLRGRLLRRAHAIVVSSDALLQESRVLGEHRERCVTIPLGVNTAWWEAVDGAEVREWNRRLGERFLLFVGRLVYYKGLEVLLEALRDTVLPLVVVGDGPMREEWETLAKVKGVASQVRFLGSLGDTSLRALYHASSLLVLPSTAPSEAFGLVQLEAMACGRAVVASRASGGVASVHVEGETGVLVPPSDPRALREALVDLWRDSQRLRRMGVAGRQRVRAFFDSERGVIRWEELLASAAGQLPIGRSTAP